MSLSHTGANIYTNMRELLDQGKGLTARFIKTRRVDYCNKYLNASIIFLDVYLKHAYSLRAQ
jgi:hypothetical protein